MRRDASPLPESLHVERDGPIAILRLNRARKRNALNDPTIVGISAFFAHLPEDVAHD